MKIAKLFLFVALLTVVLSKFKVKKHKLLNRNRHGKKKQTPKGNELNNHFGADSVHNSYGPQPKLIEHEAYIRNPDGSVVRKHIRQILGGVVEDKEGSCNIVEKEWYNACMTIKSCDICTASPHCGWCEFTH